MRKVLVILATALLLAACSGPAVKARATEKVDRFEEIHEQWVSGIRMVLMQDRLTGQCMIFAKQSYAGNLTLVPNEMCGE